MSAVLPQLAEGNHWLERLNGLNWATGFSGTSFGVRVGIRVDNPELLPKIQRHLPSDWQPSASPVVDYLYSFRGGDQIPGTRIRRFYMCFKGPCNVVRTLDESEALHALNDAIHGDLAIVATDYAFVHAGVVGWNGRAMVIPGSTCSGKSQLVLALLRAGATYYSDDVAPIDRDGRVHPAPRAIGVRDEAGVNKGIAADRFGAPIGSVPLPVGLVVSSTYEPGAVWQPRRGTAGDAALALMQHAVRAQLAPGETMQTLARAVHGARLLTGSRGEADIIARGLLAALEEIA